MVEPNTIDLLLQSRCRVSCVVHHRLVVAKQKCWLIQKYSHHLKFLAQSTNIFCCNLHCAELALKGRSFKWTLFLRETTHRAQLRNTTKLVLEQQFSRSPVWSASTYKRMVNTGPCGFGIFGGSSSFRSSLQYAEYVQSWRSNRDQSNSKGVGSNIISALWCFFR